MKRRGIRIHGKLLLALVLPLLVQTAAAAEPPEKCSPAMIHDELVAGKPVEISRVRKIPDEVLRAFGFEMDSDELLGINRGLADPGEEWNMSCIQDAKIPGSVLVFAVKTKRIWLLHYMSGGFSVRDHLVALCSDGDETRRYRLQPSGRGRLGMFYSLTSLQRELQPDWIRREEIGR
jgi:hypothetical protein